MKQLLLLGLILLGSCREFYDEEFEAFEESRANGTGGGTASGEGINISYSAELAPTDQNVTGLTGNARIDVQDDNVTVDLDIDGIPANIIQIHYSYLAADCSSLSISIPNNNTTTRSYTVNETTSLVALADDLRSAGAASSDGDTNLIGKSFVVKAFSNFSGLPNPSGTNQITILCGPITEATSDSSANDNNDNNSDNTPLPSDNPGDVFNPDNNTTTGTTPDGGTTTIGLPDNTTGFPAPADDFDATLETTIGF